MNERRRGPRQESMEAYFSTSRLLNAWEKEIAGTRQRLDSPNLEDLVGVVRSSGLRAELAIRRDRKFLADDFDNWIFLWSNLKYAGLIKALHLRVKGDGRILVARHIDPVQPEEHRERFTFVFLTEPRPYRTSVSVHNLSSIVSRKTLMSSLGQPDKLPYLLKPRKFYTS